MQCLTGPWNEAVCTLFGVVDNIILIEIMLLVFVVTIFKNYFLFKVKNVWALQVITDVYVQVKQTLSAVMLHTMYRTKSLWFSSTYGLL